MRRARNLTLGSALAVALVCASRWHSGGTTVADVPTVLPAAKSVAVLQPRTQTLPDGSAIELSEDAVIEVKFGDLVRRVELRKGAAHFAVTRDSHRPFIVSASGIDVRAVGTAFAVDTANQVVEVVVTEGKVAVESSASPAALGDVSGRPLALVVAGHRTVVHLAERAATQVEDLDEDSIRTRLAWRIPRLEFSATPLSQVVAELNQRNRIQIVVMDEEIGALRISGTLRADRLEALTDMLATDFRIDAERQGDRISLRRMK